MITLRWLAFIPIAITIHLLINIALFNFQYWINYFALPTLAIRAAISSFCGIRVGIFVAPEPKRRAAWFLLGLYVLIVAAVFWNLLTPNVTDGRRATGILEAVGMIIGTLLALLTAETFAATNRSQAIEKGSPFGPIIIFLFHSIPDFFILPFIYFFVDGFWRIFGILSIITTLDALWETFGPSTTQRRYILYEAEAGGKYPRLAYFGYSFLWRPLELDYSSASCFGEK